MTAPVGAAAFADVTAEIRSIQATLAQLSAPVQSAAAASAGTASATGASTSSGSAFAADYSSAVAQPATPDPSGAGSGTTSGTGVTGADVVTRAESWLGTPYVWGGESRSGIDCSGLVQATYHSLGIDLPRVAADQAHEGTPVASLSQAQPGDLLFFGDPAYHVAIYLGGDKLIESPEPGKTVHVTDVYQTPTSIRRILPSPSAASAPAAASGGLSASQLTAAGIAPAVAAYADRFAAAEAQYHLPTGMLAAVAQQESAGNAHAVSPAGAEGLMQLMPSTAAEQGVDPFDPDQAIGAAAHILSGDLRQFGSVPLALAAYNAGAGAVSEYGGIPPYAETQGYVRRITATMAAGG